MRLPLRLPGQSGRVPDDVAAVIAPTGGERLLAWGRTADDGTVVAGKQRLYLVKPALDGDGLRLALARSWHLVDAGTWSSADSAMTITWVDGAPPTRLSLTTPGMVPETLRERVQSSVVLVEPIDLGNRRSARAVVRRDLTTGGLVVQPQLGAGVEVTDPGVAARLEAGIERAKEQVGLT